MHLPSVISTLTHLDVLPEKNWGELWNDREPLLRSVLNGGSTVFAKDRPFYIEGHGYPETVSSTSPIRPSATKSAAFAGFFASPTTQWTG